MESWSVDKQVCSNEPPRNHRSWSISSLVRLIPIAASLSLTGPQVAEATVCAGPAGLYAGTAKSSDGTALEVTLNLTCNDGKYKMQFFTSAGDFDGSETAFTNQHLTATFDTGAAVGTADLEANDGMLSGELQVAGDKGGIVLTRVGDALPPDAMVPRLDLTPAQWHQDLRALAVELPKRHANAFFSLSKARFDAAIAKLHARIDSADGDEMFVGLQQIVKLIGDGHTGIVAPSDRRDMPLEIVRFGTDFRVTAVGTNLDKALGARIQKIGNVPISKVWKRVMTLTPRGELTGLRESNGLAYLARGYALHGLGVTPNRNRAVYTLKDDAGNEFDLEVQGLRPNEVRRMKSGFGDTALRMRRAGDPFWCENLPEDDAVYCIWRSYQELKSHAHRMFELIDATRPRKLIIDMRDNGGGDYTVGYAELIAPIKRRADLNTRGRLYVLVGSQTFSAAMNNAAQFQDETKAILVGQPIGERPNSYQEPRQFRLPNSHLIVRVSTKWYAFRKHGPNQVAPDKTIVPTWGDVKSGRDPVLEWVLAR